LSLSFYSLIGEAHEANGQNQSDDECTIGTSALQ
jgi:hypothetical protein